VNALVDSIISACPHHKPQAAHSWKKFAEHLNHPGPPPKATFEYIPKPIYTRLAHKTRQHQRTFLLGGKRGHFYLVLTPCPRRRRRYNHGAREALGGEEFPGSRSVINLSL